MEHLILPPVRESGLILPGRLPERVWAPPQKRVEPVLAAYTNANQASAEDNDLPGGSTLTVTISTPTVNRVLMLAVAYIDMLGGTGGQVSGVTLGASNFTNIIRGSYQGNGRVELWYLLVPASPGTSVVATLSTGFTSGAAGDVLTAAICAEFAGGATSSLGDGSNSNKGVGVTSTPGSVTPTQAADLSFCCMAQLNEVTDTAPANPTTPTGYTALTPITSSNTDFSMSLNLAASWKAVADTTAQNPSQTILSLGWSAAIGLMKVLAVSTVISRRSIKPRVGTRS